MKLQLCNKIFLDTGHVPPPLNLMDSKSGPVRIALNIMDVNLSRFTVLSFQLHESILVCEEYHHEIEYWLGLYGQQRYGNDLYTQVIR